MSDLSMVKNIEQINIVFFRHVSVFSSIQTLDLLSSPHRISLHLDSAENSILELVDGLDKHHVAHVI